MVTQVRFSMLATLAQVPPWRAMGSRFRDGGNGVESTTLLLVLAVVGVLVLLSWMFAKFFTSDSQRPFHGPVRLFIQLCRAHQLGVRESWLLWRVARVHGLRQPAELFIDADRLSPASIPASFSRHGKQLGVLRKRLFEPCDEASADSQ